MENERTSVPNSASGLAQRLKEDGRQTLEQRKRSAADRVDEIAQSIERAGAQFSQSEPTLSDYASRIATTVGNLATRLREGSLDDLVDDTRQLARRNPGLFIVGGVAAGFALSRFIKASAQRRSNVLEGESDVLDTSTQEPSYAASSGAPTLTDEVAEAAAAADAAARNYEAATRTNGG